MATEGRCPSSGKRRWETRGQARQARRDLIASGEPDISRLGVYRCPVCESWHVGHRTT